MSARKRLKFCLSSSEFLLKPTPTGKGEQGFAQNSERGIVAQDVAQRLFVIQRDIHFAGFHAQGYVRSRPVLGDFRVRIMLGGVSVVRGAQQNADLLVGDIRRRNQFSRGRWAAGGRGGFSRLSDEHDLRVLIVGLGEIHELLRSLVAVMPATIMSISAGLQSRDERHELHIRELDRPVKFGGDDPGQLAVVSRDPAILIHEIGRAPWWRSPRFGAECPRPAAGCPASS